MANRTSAEEVRQIIATALTDVEIGAYIAGANNLVTQVLGDDASISNGLKVEIERWLTAHFMACTRDQQLAEAGAGTAKAKFQGKTDMGLDATFYGQQVKVLDVTGKLVALEDKKVRAFLYAIPEGT